MICVECGCSVNDTFKQFSKGNIRLTHCDNCHRVADKYVEYDFIIIFLDLILHRSQVYRHILFNRTEYCDNGISIQYLKVFIVYLFFECYAKWNQLQEEIVQPYVHILIVFAVTLEFLVYLFSIMVGVHLTAKPSIGTNYGIIKYNYIIMAIILASFGKGFTFLMMIWEYNHTFSIFSAVIDIFVLTSNTLVLKVFLNSTTIKAMSLIALSFGVKTAFHFIFIYFTRYCI